MKFLIISRTRLDAGSFFLVARDIASRGKRLHGIVSNGDCCDFAEWCYPWARPSNKLWDGHPIEHRIVLDFDDDDVDPLQIFEGMVCISEVIHFRTYGGMLSRSLGRVIGNWTYEARETQEETVFTKGMKFLVGRR